MNFFFVIDTFYNLFFFIDNTILSNLFIYLSDLDKDLVNYHLYNTIYHNYSSAFYMMYSYSITFDMLFLELIDYISNNILLDYYNPTFNMYNNLTNVYNINTFVNFSILYIYLYIYIFIIVVIMSSSIYLITSKNIFMYFVGSSNELDNNFANFYDFVILFTTSFISFLIFFNYLNNSFFLLDNCVCLLTIFLLNIITLFCYLYVFNVNFFIYVKGVYDNINLKKWFVLDIAAFVIFVSRLFLQYVRLIICTCIYYLVLELFDKFLMVFYIDLNSYENFFFYQYEDFFIYHVLVIVKFILEILDMTSNFLTQFSIYVISLMWLIPYLFSFVSKKKKSFIYLVC